MAFNKDSGLSEEIRKRFRLFFDMPSGGCMIGHIAKAKGMEKGMIDVIVPIAIGLIKKAQKVVGGNLICLDCDNKIYERKYAEHGFVTVCRSPEYVGGNFRIMLYMMPRRK